MFLKRTKLIYYLLGAVAGIIVYQIINSSLSQPGLEQFKGKYEELGFYRNENNTGPVVRVLAIRSLDPHPEWMKEFANQQPHTKYGKTLVFFFSEEVDQPVELTLSPPHFPRELDSFLIASYEKTPMGEERFLLSDSK
jgi:hypothetical protein